MIVKIVVKTKNKFVLKPRFEEAKTLGIIRNIINGLTTPPVKYINIASWIISINKNARADLSESWVFL